LAAVKKNGLFLRFFEEEEDEELNLAAVKQNGLTLEFINIHKRTYKICLIAVQQNPDAIKFVPRRQEFFENNLNIVAVKQDGLILQYIQKPSLECCKTK
jgi:hypothetical protein